MFLPSCHIKYGSLSIMYDCFFVLPKHGSTFSYHVIIIVMSYTTICYTDLTHNFLDSESHCFSYNMDYAQNNVQIYPKVKSAHLCHKKCQEDSECKTFSWVSEAFDVVEYRQKCHLKSVDMDRSQMVEHKDVVTGPQNCGRYYKKLNVAL